MCLSCEDIAQQSCVMVPKWRIFRDFLHPVFSASRVQHVSDLHAKFAVKPHHVWKYGRHPTSRRLRIGDERKGRQKKKPQDENIMPHLLRRAAIKPAVQLRCRHYRDWCVCHYLNHNDHSTSC